MRTVIVFVKAPVAGRVKTRLAARVGVGRAAAIFRVLTANTIAAARAGPWTTVLAVDPAPRFGGYAGLWPAEIAQWGQGGGGLGARLARAFDKSRGPAAHGPVVVIGSDAPGVRPSHFHAAFHALGRADAVLGPSEDGGFWLLGLARRRSAPRLFQGVRWSSAHALADVVATMPDTFTIESGPALIDVDTDDDLQRVGPDALRRASPSLGP